MYGEPGTGAPPPPPPPPMGPSAPAVGAGRSGRYAYLVARLRNRQITMEEATELFGILQEALRSATMAPSTTEEPPPPPPPSTPPASGLPVLTDDTFALSLVALGAGAGLLAAILKRSAEGPRRPTT